MLCTDRVRRAFQAGAQLRKIEPMLATLASELQSSPRLTAMIPVVPRQRWPTGPDGLDPVLANYFYRAGIPYETLKVALKSNRGDRPAFLGDVLVSSAPPIHALASFLESWRPATSIFENEQSAWPGRTIQVDD